MTPPVWDARLQELINQHWTHPWLDWLMPAVSCLPAWAPVFVLAAVLAAWRGGRRARWMLLCLALAVGVNDGVVCKNLKRVIGRQRPGDAMSGVILRDLGQGSPAFLRLFQPPTQELSKPKPRAKAVSMPSSHAANLFAAAMVAAHFYRGWGAAAFLLAGLVAWSRVYVGAHWPGDIPPSVAIGLLTGAGTVAAVRWAARRLGERLMPF